MKNVLDVSDAAAVKAAFLPVMLYEDCHCPAWRRVLRLHWHRLYWAWPEREPPTAAQVWDRYLDLQNAWRHAHPDEPPLFLHEEVKAILESR